MTTLNLRGLTPKIFVYLAVLLLLDMESKKTIYLGMFIGGLIGGYAPSLLWGAGTFSFSALLGNAIGAIVGIYIAFKLTR